MAYDRSLQQIIDEHRVNLVTAQTDITETVFQSSDVSYITGYEQLVARIRDAANSGSLSQKIHGLIAILCGEKSKTPEPLGHSPITDELKIERTSYDNNFDVSSDGFISREDAVAFLQQHDERSGKQAKSELIYAAKIRKAVENGELEAKKGKKKIMAVSYEGLINLTSGSVEENTKPRGNSTYGSTDWGNEPEQERGEYIPIADAARLFQQAEESAGIEVNPNFATYKMRVYSAAVQQGKIPFEKISPRKMVVHRESVEEMINHWIQKAARG
jgi:hypothetical protein